MAVSTEDYAFLSEMAYDDWEMGAQTPPAPSGTDYEAVDFIDDPKTGTTESSS